MSTPVWKGNLSYGQTSFPVRLHSGPRNKTVHFTEIDSSDSTKLKRVNVRQDGSPIAGKLVHGYELSKGKYVPFTGEELAAARPPSSKVMRITFFIDVAEIEALWVESSYYLAPDGEDGEPAYATFQQALLRTAAAGVTRLTVSTRQRLALIRPGESGLILHTIFYADELRSIDEFRTNVSLARGVGAAAETIRSGMKRLVLEREEDVERAKLQALVDGKVLSLQVPTKKGAKG